jgi:hypothetical protein
MVPLAPMQRVSFGDGARRSSPTPVNWIKNNYEGVARATVDIKV